MEGQRRDLCTASCSQTLVLWVVEETFSSALGVLVENELLIWLQDVTGWKEFGSKKLLMPKVLDSGRFWKLVVCLRWITLSFHNRSIGRIIKEKLQEMDPRKKLSFRLT